MHRALKPIRKVTAMHLARSPNWKRLTAIQLAVALLAAPSALTGQDAPDTEAPASEAPASETPVETDMVFVAEENLTLAAASSDDVFAAGSTIDASGAVADHLFLAGGDIAVSDTRANDVIAIGGEIRLDDAVITDDVIAAGGEIIAGQGFDIGGSAVFAGGSVRLEAPVGGDLRIGASEIFVNSAIAGTARLSGESVMLGPQARIGGDLLHRSTGLTVQPGAIIEGRTAALPEPDHSTAEDIGRGAGQLFAIFGLSILISYFILVVLLVVLVPGLMRSASSMMQQRPWQSLGIGFFIALITPLSAFLLVTTVFGAPLGVLLIIMAVALTPIALAVTAYFVGMRARAIATRNPEPPQAVSARILWPVLGALLVFALTLIPLAGLLVWLLAMLFGLGAFARQAAIALAAREN